MSPAQTLRADPQQHADRNSVLVFLESSRSQQQVQAAIENMGGRVKYRYELLPNVLNARDVPADRMAELQALGGVSRVVPDQVVKASLHDSVPLINGLVSQTQAAGFDETGQGVRICVCDTGVRTDHVMYTERLDLAAGYDFVNNDADPSDDNGHGSHVAGIAVGKTGLTVNFQGGGGDEPFQGVAPEATLIAVKVLDDNGAGFQSDVIAGIDHCAAAGLQGGQAHVINLSLGSGAFAAACDSDPIAQAANAAVDAGVVVVAAVGNSGNANAIESPACASNVIAVGSTYDDNFPSSDFPFLDSFTFCLDYNIFGDCVSECTDSFPVIDQIACYSNEGNQLDVTAPGSVVWSARHDGTENSITSKHGTSQATPHVAGLAALLLGARPELTASEVRQFIRDGSIDLGAPGFDPTFGYGRIDVVNSLILATTPSCETDADCNDGQFCNGAETCDGQSCVDGTVPCGALMCRESDDACVFCLEDSHCNDADPCNGLESCNADGDCIDGSIVDCNGNGAADDCDITGGISQDCNVNNVPDECDLAGGTSIDCNINNVPDECEADCNQNGVVDDCDLSGGSSVDCNANSIPDECDLGNGSSADCNANAIPDECDLASGSDLDCNANAVPDGCDVDNGTSPDCNANGVPDECEMDCNQNQVPDSCDLASGSAADCNGNNVPDSCDIASSTSQDCNANEIPDECEEDCNGNLVPDDCDISSGAAADCNDNEVPDSCDLEAGADTDCNENGIPDECEEDCDNNQIADECELAAGTANDCNNNNILDRCDTGGGQSNDCNADQIPDECQEDCDGNNTPDDCDIAAGAEDCNENAVPDICEVAAGTLADCDQNQVPDECELASGAAQDCNANTLLDRCDLSTGTSTDCNMDQVPDECQGDCNGNGTPDDCDLATGTSEDCNANATPDECDIGSGSSEDCDGNQIPDECETDCNNNQIADKCDISYGTSDDCDDDGIPDECQADCNANRVNDDCEPPQVFTVGPRYIGVTPQPRCSNRLHALRLTSPDWPCVNRYITPSGLLSDEPVWQTPNQWGTVYVSDLEVMPGSSYFVTSEVANTSSPPAGAITLAWGDVDDNQVVNFIDINFVILAFQDQIGEEPIERYDLRPCVTNRIVNFDDIYATVQAFQDVAYTSLCPSPCP